jgi:hypothetical protein
MIKEWVQMWVKEAGACAAWPGRAAEMSRRAERPTQRSQEGWHELSLPLAALNANRFEELKLCAVTPSYRELGLKSAQRVWQPLGPRGLGAAGLPEHDTTTAGYSY